MREVSRLGVVALIWLAASQASAYAQGSIAGQVKDGSGAVLPGVTVEASSPALIEKVRSVSTDGTGQYRIVDLRPGVYSVTFTLPGFNTVKREGVELAGSFTAPIDAEMRVGAIEETITVTGETPIVDVQNATRQRVLDHQVIDAIPSARNPFALGVLIPGVVSGSQDVGGVTINAASQLAGHGSRLNDQVFLQNGINTNAMSGFGSASRLTVNMAAVQEMAIDYSAVTADQPTGGVRINLIPRDGGNAFSGTMFAALAASGMQGNNFTQDLKDRGLTTPGSLKKNWDLNPGFGGPIRKDRLWFYVSSRSLGAHNYVAGMFVNRNANNPALWTYEAEPNEPASNDATFNGGDARLTWQASARNKVGLSANYQVNCACPGGISATVAPEADLRQEFPLTRRIVADWTSPATNRLLLEAGASNYYGVSIRNPSPDLHPQMITVTEQSTGLRYRAGDAYRWNPNESYRFRGAASYITGSHAFKVGINHNHGWEFQRNFDNQPVSYRFNNGVPNQITMRAFPYNQQNDVTHDFGLFAQDSWKISRLTAGFGLRYDYFTSAFPKQRLEPAPLTPRRNIVFPATPNLRWHDVSPKLAATYDLFGTGKTAVKVGLNRYLEGMAVNGVSGDPNPLNNLVTSTMRSWNDANRDFVPQCDLLVPAANGECGAMANANFGTLIPGATYDPGLIRGFGRRGFNWEFSAGVQHEVLPRVSLDVGYFRRSYGNFVVTDDRTIGPADFDRFSVLAPAHPRLPGGGGYAIDGLYNLNPSRFGLPADNFVTRARRFGDQAERWNGLDVTMNARPRSGLTLQGGVSTGKTTTDNCEIVAKLDNPSPLYCHVETPFLTQLKGLAAYTLPRVGVLVSGTFQSLPGPQIAANYNAPSAAVAPSLGRPLSGGAANVTVNLIEPGSLYGERLNQIDLRIAKVIRFGRARSTIGVDVYNALNVSTVLVENNNFATWRRPTSILTARFAKISAQFDF